MCSRLSSAGKATRSVTATLLLLLLFYCYTSLYSCYRLLQCSDERPAEKAKSENLIYAMIQQIGDFPLVKLNDVT